VVDIAGPSQVFGQIRKILRNIILISLNCFWCVGAWRCVAHILELPVATVFFAEESLTQKQDQHTVRMWCKPKLKSNILIYLLSSVLIMTDCYWRSQGGDWISPLITTDTAVQFLTKGYSVPEAQGSFLQVRCCWFLPELIWSYRNRSEGSETEVRIMVIRGINGRGACWWVVWLSWAQEAEEWIF